MPWITSVAPTELTSEHTIQACIANIQSCKGSMIVLTMEIVYTYQNLTTFQIKETL